jgi:hypothetical protein
LLNDGGPRAEQVAFGLFVIRYHTEKRGWRIAAPLVGGMITSTIHVLILVPVFFALMKERALRKGTLRLRAEETQKQD